MQRVPHRHRRSPENRPGADWQLSKNYPGIAAICALLVLGNPQSILPIQTCPMFIEHRRWQVPVSDLNLGRGAICGAAWIDHARARPECCALD